MDLHTRHEPDRIQILTDEPSLPVLVQHASVGRRPYIHPLKAPDGKGCLTENEPWHHLWQHGVYTGLHGVNQWDFWTEGLSRNGLAQDGTFHPAPLAAPMMHGDRVSWLVETTWKSPAGHPVLIERQRWTFRHRGDFCLLDMDWRIEAQQDIQFQQCPYGGLFVRMPFRAEIGAGMLDSEGRGREEAEGQRSRWAAVSMPLAGRDGEAGIAVLDHPGNACHPVPWRVDRQFGLSPSRCILGAWSLDAGEAVHECYRLFIFCGTVSRDAVDAQWRAYAKLEWRGLQCETRSS